MAYLYRHIRLDKNEPFYVGIGSDAKYSRAYTHKSRNRYWKHIVNKTDYKVEIILDNLSWEEACKKEKEFIRLYGRKNLKLGSLCNLTDGGDGALGIILSQETREKMRKAATGQKQSAEERAKRSATVSGSKNHWYGKKLSDEHKKKFSLAKLGKKRDPEVMKRLHECNKKRVINSLTGEIYESIKELSMVLKRPDCTISRWVKNPKHPYKILEHEVV